MGHGQIDLYECIFQFECNARSYGHPIAIDCLRIPCNGPVPIGLKITVGTCTVSVFDRAYGIARGKKGLLLETPE